MIHLITGSRDFQDMSLVRSAVSFKVAPNDTIIHGEEVGVDIAVMETARIEDFTTIKTDIHSLEVLDALTTFQEGGIKVKILIFWDRKCPKVKNFIQTVKMMDFNMTVVTAKKSRRIA